MPKLEGSFTKDLKEELVEAGAKVIAFVASQMTEVGLPDRYITHKIWHGWIEFKAPRTVIKPKQIWQRNDIRLRGTKAYIIRFLDAHYAKLEEDIIEYRFAWADGKDFLRHMVKIDEQIEAATAD